MQPSQPPSSSDVHWINALVCTIVSTAPASLISIYPAVYLRDPLNTATFTTVVIPMMLVVPFGFLVAAYMYNRLSVQEIDLNKIFAGIMLSLMQFIIVFYLVGIVSIFLRIMFGASVEELSTASDNVLCVNAVLAYAATLLLGFRFASQRSRTSDAASVTAKSATNLMRNTIIAMIMMLIATTVVFLIIFL